MKRTGLNIALIVLIVLMIVGIIGFYLYDVIYNHTNITEHLFRTLAVVFALLGTLVRLIAGKGRKSLDIYEKHYQKELGAAFYDRPLLRKKLLCACRLYNENKYGKALKYLYQLLQEAGSRNDGIPVLLFIALCYDDAGAPAEAIKAYLAILEQEDTNPQVHSNLGALYIKKGDFEAALYHYNKSIQYDSENYYAYVNRANYYFRMDEMNLAVEDAQKALSIKNNGAEAASLLTIIYALQEDEENKKKYYHMAITSGKNPDDLNAAIAYFLNEKQEKSSKDEATV